MSNNNKELAARLMAVQACYQISHNAKSVRQVVKESLDHGIHMDIDGEELPMPHGGLFKKILFSLDERLADINEIVEANVNKKNKEIPVSVVKSVSKGKKKEVVSVDIVVPEVPTSDTAIEGDVDQPAPEEVVVLPTEKEIEPLLKSILLCGVTELLSHQDIDAPIIIDDYLNVTHAFYEKQQVSFVNGILDKVASSLR